MCRRVLIINKRDCKAMNVFWFIKIKTGLFVDQSKVFRFQMVSN
jgi:hypothetical protein